MNKTTIAFCVAAVVAFSSATHARIGETEPEIQARYGRPVSRNAYDAIESGYDGDRERELSRRSADEHAHDLKVERLDFPENFQKDGSRIDHVGDDALIYADNRLIFYDDETDKWERLQSSVIARKPTSRDSGALRQLTIHAKKHLRQRFYVQNGLGISVVYLDGHSISEKYHQKDRIFPADFVNALIKKSFPDSVLDDKQDAGDYPRATRISSPNSGDLQACATHLDGVLTVSAKPYYDFLKQMEVDLRKSAEAKQNSKLDGF